MKRSLPLRHYGGLAVMAGLSLLPSMAPVALGQDKPSAIIARPANRGDKGGKPSAGPIVDFVDEVRKNEQLDERARKIILRVWDDCDGCDVEELMVQGLTLIDAGFRAGLDAFERENYDEAARILGRVARSDDPFVATHAAVYRVKALTANERVSEALPMIDHLLMDGRERLEATSYFEAEVTFLRGYCLLLDLRYEEAAGQLRSFLANYPEASQRLRLSAQQMYGELTNRNPDGMADVTDLMDFSGRRLAAGDSGERVQSQQQRIVELLNKLIEEAEDQENNNSSNSQNDGSQNQQNQAPSNPMQDSRLVPGNPDIGHLRDARRAKPGEVWGAMPPAEREKILQAMREAFPSRYRQLVEQYYEELAKKP